MQWFSKNLYQYLFAPRDPDTLWWRVVLCRYWGHPHPVVWYNASGWEPDMHCTNCGDDLG